MTHDDMDAAAALLALPIIERGRFDDAVALVAALGDGASQEAAARADRSRDLGNVLGFCRWRATERVIALIALDRPPGTVH